jgi:hypothetical protein
MRSNNITLGDPKRVRVVAWILIRFHSQFHFIYYELKEFEIIRR